MRKTLHFLLFSAVALAAGREPVNASQLTPAEQYVIDVVKAKLNAKLTMDQVNDLVKRAGFQPVYSSYLQAYTLEAKTVLGEELVVYGLNAEGQLLFGTKIRNLTAAEEKDPKIIYPPIFAALQAAHAMHLPMMFHVEDESTPDVSNGLDVEHMKWKKYEVLMAKIPVENPGATPAIISQAISNLMDIVIHARTVLPAR